jgi:hypothetical protein
MGVNDIDLPPGMTMGIGSAAIGPSSRVRPSSMKLFDVRKFGQAAAVGTDKNKGVRNESNAARLVENESSWVDGRLVLVIEKCVIDALLGQHRRGLPAVHSS